MDQRQIFIVQFKIIVEIPCVFFFFFEWTIALSLDVHTSIQQYMLESCIIIPKLILNACSFSTLTH